MKLQWLAMLFVVSAVAAEPPLTPAQRGEDFDAAWRAVDQGYAYFGRERSAWRKSRPAWKAKAVRAQTRAELAAVLQAALDPLHDEHIAVTDGTAAIAGSDIWARWREGAARIEAVRPFGDADVAGVRPGLQVTRIGEASVEKAVGERLGKAAADPQGRDWALRRALAGPRDGVLRLEVADASKRRTLDIERKAVPAANGPPLLVRRMGEARDLGYIRIKAAGDARLADHFDAALHQLRDTRALMLDLRDFNSAGTRESTRAILTRLAKGENPRASREATWQVRQGRDGRKVDDKVAPAAAPYRAPLLVLVDRWTAGEGEALAAGLAAVAGARLVGTSMAGLRGELRAAKLPHSGLTVSFPAEKAFHADGTPREAMRPHVEVDLAAPSGGPGDPILYQALKLLEK